MKINLLNNLGEKSKPGILMTGKLNYNCWDELFES